MVMDGWGMPTVLGVVVSYGQATCNINLVFNTPLSSTATTSLQRWAWVGTQFRSLLFCHLTCRGELT